MKTQFWHKISDDKIQCDVCPRACKLREGQRGLCFVRQRVNDEVILSTYGRSSGYCIDPIEKKPLNHFLPGTPVLSFGTAGCNLACKFCQNWDISKSRELDTLMEEASPETIAEVAASLDCRSIAFTYNDPIIFMEYAVDVAKACRAKGIQTVAVSAGYVCGEPREFFFKEMDAANIDLKAFTEDFYHKIAGGRLSTVLDTLVYLKHKTNVWFEITTLLIPGKNDHPEEIKQLSEWVMENLGPDVPLHFTAFHPDWKMRDVPATPPETLTQSRHIALEAGLHYVYTGNVHDTQGGSTLCHHCHRCIIKRDWYNILEYHLTDQGNCEFCGTPCAGRFDGPAGTWGAKRVPISLDY